MHLNGSVPKSSGLGPFLYVVMINDLVASGLLLHKFMNDPTVTDTIDNPAESKMQDASEHVVKWTEENNTRINGTKLLGLIISNDLKWHLHVDSICSKASWHIHFLT